MFRPQFELKIGSLALGNKKNKNLISISIEQSLEIPADSFTATFSNDDKQSTMKVKKGEKATVSLGYDDGLSEVFNGTVNSIDSDPYAIKICSLTSMIKLCRLRVDLFFTQQTAGMIVKDLLKSAKVDAEDGSPADGIQFPYYAIDSNKSAYEHIKELSALNDFITYVNNKDKFVFKKFQPKKVHPIEYGKDIITMSRSQQTLPFTSVTTFGESPSSVLGSDKAHWLTKKQVKAQSDITNAGRAKQGTELLQFNRFLKDDATSSTSAKSTVNRLKMLSEVVSIKIPGNQKIALGDAVELKNIPDESLSGKYRIRDIHHDLSKTTGFVTSLRCTGPI